MKKAITALLLAGVLLIPSTGAFAASSTPLADAVYGSFSDLKKVATGTTMEQYRAFNEKMEAAQGILGAADFAAFESLLHDLTAFNMQFMDKDGNINYAALTPEQRAELQRLQEPLQPYFDHLNAAMEQQEQAQATGAAQFQYADAVYGSFATLKKAVPSSTMEDYKRFNDKIAGAKKVLAADEFNAFFDLIKQMTALDLPFYDDKGNLDTSKMTADQLAQQQKLIKQLGPYFEKLEAAGVN